MQKLDLVLNLDMVGYPSLGLGKVIVEYDLGNKITTNDVYSKNVGQFISEIDSEYTNLEAHLLAQENRPDSVWGHR